MRAVPWALAILLLAVPILAPLYPPASAPTGDTGTWSRVYPGVPGAWVALRLVALAAGAALVATLSGAGPWTTAPHIARAPEPRRAMAVAATGVAVLLLGLALRADGLSRGMQLAFLVLLAVPALLLRVRADADERSRGLRSAAWTSAGVIALWLGVGLVAWPHAPRSADAVDTWLGFQFLGAASLDGRNILREGFLTGMNGVPLFLQGLPLFGPGRLEPSFGVVQAFHALWLALSAALVARLAARWIGGAAAPIAAAAFLFSPFVLLFPMNPTAYFQGPLYTAILLTLLDRFWRTGSAAALAGLVALGAVAATNPAATPVVAVVGVVTACRAWRGPRPAPLPALAALLVGVAALLATAPGPGALRAMAVSYTALVGDWDGLEAVLLGQRTPFDVPALWGSGWRGPADIALGAVLSPFAVARTPLRLWGDVLLDPLGGALAAVGIALSLRGARREPALGFLLALLAAALAPGVTSSYDRPSHTRMFCMPVPLALASALGFEALRRAFPRARALTPAALAGVAAGGLAVFHVVTPSLLPSSALTLAFESRPPDEAVLLEHPPPWDPSWLHVRRLANALPEKPLRVAAFRDAGSLAAPSDGDGPVGPVLLWSPALEYDLHVGEVVCARFATARRYTIVDRIGRSRLLAADVAGSGWEPALPRARWSASPCAADGGAPR
jgi:hypothetical protein